MRTTRRVSGSSAQFDLFSPAMDATGVKRVKNAVESGRRFISGSRAALFVGTTPLDQYLHDLKEHAPLKVSRLLDEQDWRMFESRYAASGRAPYAPRAMMGLILYGVMQGVHSLRELERMARLDLGCMWVSCGIAPDHANIGRFIVMHEDLLKQDFFESFTRSVLNVCGSGSARVAGDGTVIEAACSHYKLLKEEAVKEHAQAMRQAAAQAKDDTKAQQRADQAGQCEAQFEQRKVARIKRGQDTKSLCVSPTEPDAVMTKLKRGRGFAPAYKPSVLANEDQIITALAVDASSETDVVAQMLDQVERITGAQPDEALFDTGYFHDAVIEATFQREVSLLCPAPPSEQASGHGQSGGKFHKSQFDYDANSDTYCCPAGQVLHRIASVVSSAVTREHSKYACDDCQACLMRARCTSAKTRSIKRYPEDKARDALRHVMRQPKAQQVFQRRKAMVEPIFARLRGKQKLDRFRRRGLTAVTREFALHALAYNLGRAVALCQAIYAFILAWNLRLFNAQNDKYRVIRRSALRYANFSPIRLLISA